MSDSVSCALASAATPPTPAQPSHSTSTLPRRDLPHGHLILESTHVTNETPKPLTFIDECIEKIYLACCCDPVDWPAIRGIAMQIEMQAKTKGQKDAAYELKRAADVTRVHMTVHMIQRTFLHGKPDADGWLRRF